MRRFSSFLDFVQGCTEYILFFLVGSMVVIVFAQVVFRFILRASLPWSEEASRYIMVWLSMLGAGIGLRRKGHIGVEALTMLFPKPLKRATAVFGSLVAILFCGGLILYGVRLLRVVAAQESPAMEISMAIPYGALVAGGTLMLFYALEAMLLQLRGEESSL
nr:TRAP transporter small permease [uncultured Fretibacterium sp.]